MALCWLRGWVQPENIRVEYIELIRYNELSGTLGGNVDNNNRTLFSKLAYFKDPSVYRPMRLIMIIFFISSIVSIGSCKPFLSKIMTAIGILSTHQSLLLV